MPVRLMGCLRFVFAAVCIVGLCNAATAQEHDHQPWDIVAVGRLVTLGRMDKAACRTADFMDECGVRAAAKAVERLEHARAALGCRQHRLHMPLITKIEPLSEHDAGMLVAAEYIDVMCSYGLRQQLLPVRAFRFRDLCSRIGWKCDVIWISDGDPSEWLIGRIEDIPLPS